MSTVKNELKIENNNRSIQKNIQLESAHRARQVCAISSVVHKWSICGTRCEKHEVTTFDLFCHKSDINQTEPQGAI